jgi:hypothetical protein
MKQYYMESRRKDYLTSICNETKEGGLCWSHLANELPYYNTLLKERYKGGENEEEYISSYWITNDRLL